MIKSLTVRIVCVSIARVACALSLTTQKERLARWRPVEMPFHFQGLSTRERQMVAKWVEACQLLDNVYWRQSDLDGLALYKKNSDPTTHALLGIMGGRWDLLDENRPFVGDVPMPPGHELYPHELTREKIEDYLRQHPDDRAAVYDPFTVVKWKD